MADKKISALTASTTPLAGTEVLPIVQSGATVKVAVSDLTAGRAISATQLTLSTGGAIIGTAGQGIDFSATANAPGMTSELLNDYEEGTWTPTLTANTSGTITLSSPTNSLNYTKIGRLVTVTGKISVSSVSVPLGLLILGGLPITSGSSSSKNSGAGAVYADSLTAASALSARVAENTTNAIIATPNQGDAAPTIQAGTSLYINIAYTV